MAHEHEMTFNEYMRLREENARLRAEVEDRQDMVDAQRGRLMELQSDNADLKAEVKRLERLILDWYENADDEPTWQALVAEAKRIRGEK